MIPIAALHPMRPTGKSLVLGCFFEEKRTPVNEESIRENPKFLFSISMRSGTPLVHIHIHLDA